MAIEAFVVKGSSVVQPDGTCKPHREIGLAVDGDFAVISVSTGGADGEAIWGPVFYEDRSEALWDASTHAGERTEIKLEAFLEKLRGPWSVKDAEEIGNWVKEFFAQA